MLGFLFGKGKRASSVMMSQRRAPLYSWSNRPAKSYVDKGFLRRQASGDKSPIESVWGAHSSTRYRGNTRY